MPVLRIDGADGNPRAVVFACACHNTTLGGDSLVVSGDYAGYAQADVEQRHPDVQAMFMIGCGADANPYPRGTIELAKAHGRALADVVEKHLEWQAPAGEQRSVDRRSGAADMTPVSGPLAPEYSRLSLPLRVVPSVEAMKAERDGKDSWNAHHARLMLEIGVGQFAPEVQKELIDHVIDLAKRASNRVTEASTPAPSGLSKP